MNVYISGPMTGHKDLNFPAFIAAAFLLRDAGYSVVSPHDINTDPSAEWSQCETFRLSSTPIWVRPVAEAIAVRGGAQQGSSL